MKRIFLAQFSLVSRTQKRNNLDIQQNIHTDLRLITTTPLQHKVERKGRKKTSLSFYQLYDLKIIPSSCGLGSFSHSLLMPFSARPSRTNM